MKKTLLIVLILLSITSSYSQNNNSFNKYLKVFLEEYPMYKNNIDKLYFEHIGMNRPQNTKQYFNVYRREYIGNENKRVKFYNNGQLIWGDIQYMLFPIVFSTHRVVVTPNPPPSVISGIKYIIISKYGTKIIPISGIRIN